MEKPHTWFPRAGADNANATKSIADDMVIKMQYQQKKERIKINAKIIKLWHVVLPLYKLSRLVKRYKLFHVA